MNILRASTIALIAGGLAACTNGNGAVEPPIKSVDASSSSYYHLQFAAGTANIAGTIGLNTVVTLRQPNGLSAYGYTTPSITWDGAFTNTGPTAVAGTDAGLKQITGVLPPNPLGSSTPPTTTFGSGGNSWGAFGYGFDPSNSDTGASSGAVQDPCLPFFATSLSASTLLSTGTPVCTGGGAQFLGGPPAFPQLLDAPLAGEIGSFLGFTPFAGIVPAANPATGNTVLTLNIAVPTSPVLNLPAATAKITKFTPLPLFATPAFTPDNAGGGSIAYTLPAGVTEALLIVYDWGPTGTGGPNCAYGSSAGAPVIYSIEVTSSSPNPAVLTDKLGPVPTIGSIGNHSTDTICSAADNTTALGATSPADMIQVVAVGFDYPAIEAGYPASNGNPTPNINNGGQDDVTISDLSPLAVY